MSDKQLSASQVEGKHTPGPWEVTDDGYIIKSKKCQVGEVYFYSYEDGERIDIPYRANARLMAAAPEMLLILKAFVANGLDAPEFLFARDMAEKTIAKIEGDE